MSRNAAAVGALVLVGGLLWLVTAWPTPEDDRPDPLEPEAPLEQPQQPAAAPPEPSVGTPPKEPEPVAPQPAPQPQAQALPMRQPHAPADDMFAKDQGPVAEYKQLYESEPRDSAANETESAIRAAFVASDGSPDLFKSVLCRQMVCKLELRWSSDRTGAYVAGITRAAAVGGGFSPTVAVTQGGPLGDDNVRPIEVYIKRKPVTDTELPPPQAQPGQPAQPAAAEAPAAEPEYVPAPPPPESQ